MPPVRSGGEEKDADLEGRLAMAFDRLA